MRTPRKNGSRKTTLKAWPLSTRFWNEPRRPQDRLRHGCDPGAGDRLAGAVVPRFASQRVRGARWRGFVLIAQLLLSQVPKFIFPTFGPAGFFPKLVRSRVDLLFARFWHYISPSWSTAPPSGGLGHIGGTVPDQLGETGHPIQVHMKPLVPRETAHKTKAKRALQRMALAGLSRSSRGFVIKMAPARGSAP